MKALRVDSKVATILACLMLLEAARVCDAQWPAGDAARRDAVATAVCPAGAFAIANTSAQELSIGAAFDGTHFLVGVQGDQTFHADITAQLVSQSGALVGPRIFTGRTGGAPYVAFDGANYVMVWPDDALGGTHDVVYGLFVSPARIPVGSPFVISQGTDNEDVAGIAFDGSNYLVTWTDQTDPTNWDVSGRFVNPSGVPVDEAFSIVACPGNQGISPIAFGGGRYLVDWNYGVRIQNETFADVLGTFVSLSPERGPRRRGPASVSAGHTGRREEMKKVIR